MSPPYSSTAKALALPSGRIGAADPVATLAARAKALLERGRARPGLALAVLYLAALAIAVVAPGLLTRVDPQDADAARAFLSPSAAHWLGTDENGRDELARLIHGTGASVGLGAAAMAISLGLGIVFGLAGGLGGRLADTVTMRLSDVLAAVPAVLFALLVITFWGDGTFNLILAIGIATMTRYARLVRTQTLLVRKAPFVEAAITLGLARGTIILRHILPNAVRPALLLAVIGVGDKIAFAATLSFLGFGAPPPAPEWGGMLSIGRNYVSVAPWLVAGPALAVTLTVLAVTAVGREIIRRGEGRR